MISKKSTNMLDIDISYAENAVKIKESDNKTGHR